MLCDQLLCEQVSSTNTCHHLEWKLGISKAFLEKVLPNFLNEVSLSLTSCSNMTLLQPIIPHLYVSILIRTSEISGVVELLHGSKVSVIYRLSVSFRVCVHERGEVSYALCVKRSLIVT